MSFATPEDEGSALAAALFDAWRAELQQDGSKRVVWDGRSSIEWMMQQELSDGPNQNEWQGFYWESRGRAILNGAFTPNPDPPQVAFGHTVFDYAHRFVWDLKAHTESWRSPATGAIRAGQSAAPLNDQEAMERCIEEQGLGFLMVGGVGVEDADNAFVSWHRAFKETRGVNSSSSNSGRSRMRKAAFEPLHVEAFFFHNTQDLNAAKAAGYVTGFVQGKQAPDKQGAEGRSRRPKYNLNVGRARSTRLAVARFEWPNSVT